MAEYERAKIAERSRRGKRHAARGGSVNVLSGAPVRVPVCRQTCGRWPGAVRDSRRTRRCGSADLQLDGGGRALDRGHLSAVARAKGPESEGENVLGSDDGVGNSAGNPAFYVGQAGFGKTRVGPARPKLRPQARASGSRPAGGVDGRNSRPRSGFRSRSRPLWTTRCTQRPLPSNWLRIASGEEAAGKPARGEVPPARSWWYAEGAGMRLLREAVEPFVSEGQDPALRGVLPVHRDGFLSVLVVSECKARTSSAGPMCWTKRCGRMRAPLLADPDRVRR